MGQDAMPAGYPATGRFLLVHEGVVNVRQFGARGFGNDLDSQIGVTYPIKRFYDEEHLTETYQGDPGSAFSGLLLTDTVDWAAIQAALEWCGANGVRCEIPSGRYMCRRPLWMGDDTTYAVDSEDNNIEPESKDARAMGLTFTGQTGNSRQQADGGVANIVLARDSGNRFAFSIVHAPPEDDTFSLQVKIDGVLEYTTALDGTDTAQDLVDVLQTLLDVDYVVALDGTNGATLLADETVFFTVDLAISPPPPKFNLEILVVQGEDHDIYTNWAHCFPDCAVISFRRSAGLSYRLEHLTLSAEGFDNVPRFASFGILFVTSQFFGHIVENVEMAYIDTAVGILKGTGNNGEQTRIDRLHALEVRRMLYTNAPQAFSQEFLGWNGHLQNANHTVLTDLVFAEFDDADKPGFGANFYNASATFSEHDYPESDATVVRTKRGTGTVQFVGGRFEHTTCLFNYDALNDVQRINNNMDVVFRGVEFTVVGGGTRRLVFGENSPVVADEAENATQYGLFVDTCTFDTFFSTEDPEFADYIFESEPFDKLRCVFQNSRFLGVRSLQQRTIAVAFRQCYKTDFIAAGNNESPLRQFTDEPPIPGARTQSLRNAWQDTPWIQTGPRVNILRNADFEGLDYSTAPNIFGGYGVTMPTPWVLEDSSDKLSGFGKWAAFKDSMTPSTIADLSPSPEAFYMSFLGGTKLWQPFDEEDHDVDISIEGPKICTYQCLCRVKGEMRFALVRCIDGALDLDTVFDEIRIKRSDLGETTLVTLRAQIDYEEPVIGDSPHPYVALLVESSDLSQWQVFWQQAWASEKVSDIYVAEKGLRNTGFVRTATNHAEGNDFAWGINSLSIKAVGRLQIPNLNPVRTTDQEVNVGWKNPYDATGEYDLFDGEVYWDVIQQGVVCRMAETWYMLHQPERIMKDPLTNHTWVAGEAKNVLYTVNAGRNLTLSTDVDEVVPGTVVRVIWQYAGVSSGSMSVSFGGTGAIALAVNTAAEFVFYNNGGTGEWLVTQANVPTKG